MMRMIVELEGGLQANIGTTIRSQQSYVAGKSHQHLQFYCEGHENKVWFTRARISR